MHQVRKCLPMSLLPAMQFEYIEYKPRFPSTEWSPREGGVTSDQLIFLFVRWLDVAVEPYLLEQAEPDLWERIAL